MSKSNFIQVNKSNPCPVCQGTNSNCAFTDNVVFCHRIPSDDERKDKFGQTYWRHRRKRVPYNELPESAKHKGKRRVPTGPFDQGHFLRLERGTNQMIVCETAEKYLGVPARAFQSLDMRWCPAMNMAVVPMKSADGRTITGMNGRHFVQKDKVTPSHVKQNAEGSADGLFIPMDLDTYDGNLVVCEGASDTAAALAMGMRCAIGRSSCRTGVQLVRELCEMRRIRHVTIIADRDKPVEGAPEGVGMAGAQELAAALRELKIDRDTPITVEIRQPREGCKDLRDEYLARRI